MPGERETALMRRDRLPLTYDESRARFHRAAVEAALPVTSHAISARGPAGQELTIDVVAVGPERPHHALVVLSGVHGVEGFVTSAMQCDLLGRLDVGSLPAELGVLVVHAVNPWGMAWWRRQNESNVDLNRNWRRDEISPPRNEAYAELHPIACPDTPDLPDVADMLVAASALVAERGLAWVRDGITVGQYEHADGLHFGGDRTEESNRVLEGIVEERLAGIERALVVDLHTGHGPPGQITLLSDAPPGSEQDQFFRRHFPTAKVEATTDNPDATTGVKVGQIANGIRESLVGAECWSTSLEVGTTRDEEQLAATYQEQWVHRRGDRTRADHAAAVWAYRCCFTPDDPEWEAIALEQGARQLDDALTAIQHPRQ